MAAIKPHLAVTATDLDALPYPLMASRKKDGFRGLITADGAQTRSGEKFPNRHVQRLLSELPVGLDGEVLPLVDGKPNFKVGGGNLRRFEGEPDFEFHLIDDFAAGGDRGKRHAELRRRRDAGEFPDWVKLLEQTVVWGAWQVKDLFAKYLEDGDEGVVLCRPEAAYKGGKASGKNATWWKVKPYEDAEAVVIGTFERMHNTNEATQDALGHTKRRNTKDAKQGTGLLGGFICVRLSYWHILSDLGRKELLTTGGVAGYKDSTFEVSAGKTTHVEKAVMWTRRDELLGRIIRYQHVTVGDYDKPRHGTFQGFRDAWDLDAT
ncbi:MAG: hypothetical protein WA154_12835 [Moraxellaceae bacterium]